MQPVHATAAYMHHNRVWLWNYHTCSLVPPPSLDDLIWGLLDGIRVQQSGCSEDQLPNLLAPEVLAGQLKYYKALRACAEGMQRLAYEAVREEDVKGKKDKALSVVVRRARVFRVEDTKCGRAGMWVRTGGSMKR